MTEKELQKYVEERMILTQTNFDSTKSIFLTAGLLVAISLSIPSLQQARLWGHSGIKVIMASTIVSAICQVLSYVFAEHQVKRHDKLLSGTTLTRTEALVLGKHRHVQAKVLPWYYGKFHNFLITTANNLATTFLLVECSFYAY
jgi:hypothetical protein